MGGSIGVAVVSTLHGIAAHRHIQGVIKHGGTATKRPWTAVTSRCRQDSSTRQGAPR